MTGAAGDAVRRAREVLAAYGRWEPELGAFVHFDLERVTRVSLGTELPTAGSLNGLALGVKDIFDTADAPTEYGSPIFRGRRCSSDSSVVAALRREGALLVGKTATAELAVMSPPATRNPHDPTRTPGGSSSGSAAAVSAGIVDVALGTQTAGSVARPASYCGVLGFKPTFGLISRAGVLECSQSLDTIGLLGGTVEGLRRVGSTLMISSLATDAATVAALKVGVVWPTEWAEISDASRLAVDSAAVRIASVVSSVSNVGLPGALGNAVQTHRVVMRGELARSYSALYHSHRSELSDALVECIEEGLGYGIVERRHADQDRIACDRALADLFGSYDVLVAPAAFGEAPAGLGFTGDPSLCAPWTMLGVPTLTVPSTRGPNGLPVGITMVARRFADSTLLDVADAIGAEADSVPAG